MKLEIGKYYKTETGYIELIFGRSRDSRYSYLGKSGRTYTETGMYNVTLYNLRDLIVECNNLDRLLYA